MKNVLMILNPLQLIFSVKTKIQKIVSMLNNYKMQKINGEWAIKEINEEIYKKKVSVVFRK